MKLTIRNICGTAVSVSMPANSETPVGIDFGVMSHREAAMFAGELINAAEHILQLSGDYPCCALLKMPNEAVAKATKNLIDIMQYDEARLDEWVESLYLAVKSSRQI